MRRQFGWGGRSGSNPRADAAWEGYRDALTLQFGGLYGTDANDVKCWQHLCDVLRINPIPDDLETCREVCWLPNILFILITSFTQVVAATHVNLVNLVEIGVPPRRAVEIFANVFELSEKTMETGKYFPRQNAKAGGLFRHLLRRIGHYH